MTHQRSTALPGKRLDGTDYEQPNLRLDAKNDYRVHYGPRNTQLRLPGFQFNAKWYKDRVKRGAFGKDPEIKTFLSRYLFFHYVDKKRENQDEDDEWGPVRALGVGGFGMVGLWEKRDKQNRTVDQLVVKDMRRTDYSENLLEFEPKRRLVREAIIQRDINTQHPGVAPHLRGYKYIADLPAGRVGTYRFFMEYCPHGSLEYLRRLYRFWDTYLPEVFVWYVFQQLAKACGALWDPPPLLSKAIEERVDRYIAADANLLYCLHGDWKPGNVLLANPRDATQQDFPAPLLSDYGCAGYISRDGSPRALSAGGTRVFVAPEALNYGADWPIPADGGLIRDKPARRRSDGLERPNGGIIPGHQLNIYGLGHAMFQLVTLGKDVDLQALRAPTFEDYCRNSYHQIPQVRTKKPGVYSSRLRHLIHCCIDPDPAKRPSQLELIQQTSRGLRLAQKRAGRPVKVHFRNHEINDMPLGDAGFKPKEWDLIKVMQSQFVDPDAPRVRLPEKKYGDMLKRSDDIGKPWKKLYDQANPHNNWFIPVKNLATQGRPGADDSDSDDDNDDDGADKANDDDDEVDSGIDYESINFDDGPDMVRRHITYAYGYKDSTRASDFWQSLGTEYWVPSSISTLTASDTSLAPVPGDDDDESSSAARRWEEGPQEKRARKLASKTNRRNWEREQYQAEQQRERDIRANARLARLGLLAQKNAMREERRKERPS